LIKGADGEMANELSGIEFAIAPIIYE
jgi:hypothetical protein